MGRAMTARVRETASFYRSGDGAFALYQGEALDLLLVLEVARGAV